MSTEIERIFERLAAPFPDHEVKTLRKGGVDLRYITARMARRRLNEVLGPDKWSCNVVPSEKWVVCHLSISLPDGNVLVRSAMGGYPKMPSEEDSVKGGDSDAFKRACVLFGVGEYLYGDDPVAHDAPFRGPGPATPPVSRPAPAGAFHAGPGPRPAPGRPAAARPAPTYGRKFNDYQPPKTAKGFLAWTFKQEELWGYSKWELVNLINATYGEDTEYGYPRMLGEWDDNQVHEGVQLVMAHVASEQPSYSGQYDKFIDHPVDGSYGRDVDRGEEAEDGRLPF